MATNYPAGLDNLTNPVTTDPVNSPSHAVQHANANDAIEALQAKVGTNNSAVSTSLDYRVGQLDTALSNLSNTVTTAYVPVADVGQPDGVASLDSTGKIPLAQMGNLVDGAPTALDTLNELAAALGDNPNYATDITTALGTKVSKNGGDTITASSASTKGLIIKGAASQTANLQEWQISDGTAIAYLTTVSSNNNSAHLYIGGGADWKIGSNELYFGRSGGNSYITHPTNFTISTSYGGSVIVKAAASQTANLTEWQNSSGTVLASIDSNGQLRTPQILNIASFNNSRLQMTNTGSLFDVGVASNVALRVRGAASQTANLQEWQNNSGTVLARVSSGGAIVTSGVGVFGSQSNTPNAQLYILSNNTLNPALVVEGASGQTSTNIFEVQRAGGGDASFRVSHNYIDLVRNTTAAASMTVYGPNAGAVPLYVKGRASQTADLQQWQNSSGTVLAKITSTGAFDATAITVNGSPVSGGAQYQTTAPSSPTVGQIWIDSDDDIEAFDLTNKKTEIPASISANTNLVAGRRYFVTSASALTLTLPASPALNDEIQVIDASGNASTYNITIARNGNLINGTAGNLIIDNNGGWYSLVYTGNTYGWKVG